MSTRSPFKLALLLTFVCACSSDKTPDDVGTATGGATNTGGAGNTTASGGSGTSNTGGTGNSGTGGTGTANAGGSGNASSGGAKGSVDGGLDGALPDGGQIADGGGPDGAAATGECCVKHDSPGCKDKAVTTCVCNQNSACCSDKWDDLCVALALNDPCKTIANCKEDCCTSTTAAGCRDPGIEACTCAKIPSCCETGTDKGWTETCVLTVGLPTLGSTCGSATCP